MNAVENTPKILVILGPTASGKSDLGMELARRYHGEIICADSRTVYRGMDIGTAKPSASDQAEICHWGLDLVDPGETYSAAEWKTMAELAITDIAARGNLPIVVGGSGLYIDALLYNYTFTTGDDTSNRDHYNAMELPELLVLLKKQNPEKYDIIDRANKRRIIRALENTENSERRSQTLRPNTLVLGLRLNKEVIQKRIKLRAEKMLEKGIIDEVRRIGETYGWESEAMSGIIYSIFSEVAKTADNNSEKIQQAVKRFIAGDQKLVKKQLTWFRRNPDTCWLDAEDPAALVRSADAVVRTFLAN